MAEDILRWLIA